ncbi:hypothetical protein SBDP1_30026 [Syntrophobacter sp. SbD1]|nr:hypothetical protein SBDP1_30026 [Syntrophobacter sp. SbD1]
MPKASGRVGLKTAKCHPWGPLEVVTRRAYGNTGTLPGVSKQKPLITRTASDTYRAAYTVRFAGAVYVLHVFQIKSKHGIATPKEEIEKVKSRLKIVEEMHGGKRSKQHE